MNKLKYVLVVSAGVVAVVGSVFGWIIGLAFGVFVLAPFYLSAWIIYKLNRQIDNL